MTSSREQRRRIGCGIEQLERRWLLVSDPFTLVMLPDTQYYSQSFPATFHAQTQWIVDNLATRNIRFVTHVGDVVETSSSDLEWQRADAAIDRLDGDLSSNPNGRVPYSIAIGNHDFEPIDTHQAASHFIANFGTSRYAGRDWYGGSSGSQLNHYQIFSAGDYQFLHITIEWEARDSAIEWAQSILDAHPDMPTILSTHDYLESSVRSTVTRTSDGNSGEQMFQDLVNVNPQIFMVLNGHYPGESHRVVTNSAGLPVVEMRVDFQSLANGGNGYLRVLEFRPNDNRIDATTYSPTLNAFQTDANSQFSISMDFDERFDFSFKPEAQLAIPLDNSDSDVDPREFMVRTNVVQPVFDIQLVDHVGTIVDSSVTNATVSVRKDGIALLSSSEYQFSYNSATDRIRLTALNGSFGNGTYEVTLNGAAEQIMDSDGQALPLTIFVVDIDTALPSVPTAFYFSATGTTSIQGLPFADEDIAFFNGSQFSTTFDGSDVGLGATGIDGFTFVTSNVLLLSFRDALSIPGIGGTVDDSDIVRFTATSLGTTTTGTFDMYFDGSDVGLSTSGEDIDAFDILADGSILFSTAGALSVTGMVGADEDVIRFVPTSLGANTSGTFSIYLDGSDLGLADEDIDGFSIYGPSDVYVTLTDKFIANNLSIANEDIASILTLSLGADTSGIVRPILFFDGSQFGVNTDITDFKIPLVYPPGNRAPDAQNDAIEAIKGQQTSILANGNASVLWNDTDPDGPGDPLSVQPTLIRAPEFGTVTVNSDGTFLYLHDGSKNFSDVFLYRIVDASGASDIAAVTISVTTNHAPTLSGLPDITLVEGATDNTIDLDDFYSDVETPSSSALFEVVSAFAGVTTSINGTTHVLTITADNGFEGEGDITVRVTDTGNGKSPPLSVTDTLHVTVNPGTNQPLLFFTVLSNATLPGGVAMANEDIAMYDGANFQIFFDGSDVGLSSARLTDFAIISDTVILLTFSASLSLPGISQSVDPYDIVEFTATQLGTTTAGTFSLYFDGFDVGLDNENEYIDGVDLLSDGRLLISTKGVNSVPGVEGRDEDLLAFSPTSLGGSTEGAWSVYFDGSDVGLSSYDVDGAAVESNGNILLSLDIDFTLTGVSGADDDIIRFQPTSLGSNTTGSYEATPVFDGSAFGLSANDILGVEYASVTLPGGEGEGQALAAASSAPATSSSSKSSAPVTKPKTLATSQATSTAVSKSSSKQLYISEMLQLLPAHAVDALMARNSDELVGWIR